MHDNGYQIIFNIYICFSNGILKNSRAQILNEDVDSIAHETQFLSLDDDELESETISMQQYKESMQLVPQIQKMKDTIRRMKEDIESKDAQIEQLRLRCANQCKEKMCISTSHLSTVSTL